MYRSKGMTDVIKVELTFYIKKFNQYTQERNGEIGMKILSKYANWIGLF